MLCLAVVAGLSACSVRDVAIGSVADALSGGGGVFASDPDPELVREALPFGLKTYESLLASAPNHVGLRTAAAKGFTAYAYMLKEDADRAADDAAARVLRQRAKGLFLRGRDHAMAGLEVRHPGIGAALASGAPDALAPATAEDAALLYWAGAGWAGAISTDKQDFMLLADLGKAGRLVERVTELDPAYDNGAAQQFLVTYEGGRPSGNRARAREYYARGLEISGGGTAGLHLALAETVSVREQNLAEFRRLLDAALAVDLDAWPERRVANTLAQRRARWLKGRIPDLFFDTGEGPTTEGTS